MNYGAVLRQCCICSFSIDQVSFRVDQTTCGSFRKLKHLYALRSMIVLFRHRALKRLNWQKLLQVTQAIRMIVHE